MYDFIQTLLAICGGVAIIGGAVKIIVSALNPYKTLVKKVDTHDALLCNDNNRFKEIEESIRMLLKCQIVVIEHLATGNHIEKLQETQKELQEFLIDR